MKNKPGRLDHSLIESAIHEGAKVIDLGCGEGSLIARLEISRHADVQGVELDAEAIYRCVEKGLSVLHGDLDNGLNGYPDKIFDYVILNQSLQEVRHVEYLLEESFRVGHRVIIGIPNFANIEARFKLFFKGEAPVTGALPNQWYDTPNLRFLSLKDFKGFCRKRNIEIEHSFYIGRRGLVYMFTNLFARNAVFVLKKKEVE